MGLSLLIRLHYITWRFVHFCSLTPGNPQAMTLPLLFLFFTLVNSQQAVRILFVFLRRLFLYRKTLQEPPHTHYSPPLCSLHTPPVLHASTTTTGVVGMSRNVLARPTAAPLGAAASLPSHMSAHPRGPVPAALPPAQCVFIFVVFQRRLFLHCNTL